MSRKHVTDFLVCKAYAERKQFDKWPYELLAEWTGEPEKVCYRAMERSDDRGYIEYGTSLRSGWLTDKGIQLLQEEMNKHESNSDRTDPGTTEQQETEADEG